MKISHLVFGLLLIANFLCADTLDEYVKIGLNNNLALKQKVFNYKKSSHALNEARGMFLPSLSVEARYTRAGGGRKINFPVGDMLNPVYSTLNQLTASQNFSQIENVSIPFLREKEHDSKLRVVQPIFQSALFSNYGLKNNLEKSTLEELNLYKQELIKEIKTAYYQYLQASKIVDLYRGTLSLVEENIRVSDLLFKNDIATKDVIFRAKAEKLKIDQKLSSANEKYVLAKSYFNFLLNRDLEENITIENVFELPTNSISIQEAEKQALQKRREIQQLEHLINASNNLIDLSSANYYPAINFVFDYGYQGENYSFNENDDYWMASTVLSWNLFNGFQDSEKRQQSVLDTKTREAQLLELKNHIRLQVKEAYHNLETSKKNYELSKEQEKFTKESFNIISKKYEEGMASQIELIDARVNKTNSEITTIVSYYGFLIKNLHFQHVIGALKSKAEKE